MLATSWGRQFETTKQPTKPIPEYVGLTMPMEPRIANPRFIESSDPQCKIIPADRYSTGIVYDKVNVYPRDFEPENKLTVLDFSPLPGTRAYAGIDRLENFAHVNRGTKTSKTPNRILLYNNFKPSTIDNGLKWAAKYASDVKSDLTTRDNALERSIGNICYSTAKMDDFVNAKDQAEKYKKEHKKRGPTADPLSHIIVARGKSSGKWTSHEAKILTNYILDQLPEGCDAYVGKHYDTEKGENALHIIVKRTDKDGKLLLNSPELTSRTLAIQAQMLKDRQSNAYQMPSLAKFENNITEGYKTKSIDTGLEDCGLLSCKGAVKDSVAVENYIAK